MEDDESLYIALQICDSGFPGGSFAHSVGLESSFHHKLIHNTSSALNLFVSLTLEQAASFQLPLILASHEAYLLKDQINHVKNECISLDSLIHIDSLCHSSLTNEVARRSSITQGKCFFRASREAFSSTSKRMTEFCDIFDLKNDEDKKTATLSSTKYYSHYAPLFGAICGVLQISKSLTCKMFLRCMLRDTFSSAARLNIVGPLDGAKRQKEFSQVIGKLLAVYDNNNNDSNTNSNGNDLHGNLDILDWNITAIANIDKNKKGNNNNDDNVDDNDNTVHIGKKRKFVGLELLETEPTITCPILEILQARHDVLYARLFNS